MSGGVGFQPPPPPPSVGHCGGLWVSAEGTGQGFLPLARHFVGWVGGSVSNSPPPPPSWGWDICGSVGLPEICGGWVPEIHPPLPTWLRKTLVLIPETPSPTPCDMGGGGGVAVIWTRAQAALRRRIRCTFVAVSYPALRGTAASEWAAGKYENGRTPQEEAGGGGYYPPPPPTDQSGRRGKTRNLQFGKFGWAIFGTQICGCQLPPLSPPPPRFLILPSGAAVWSPRRPRRRPPCGSHVVPRCRTVIIVYIDVAYTRGGGYKGRTVRCAKSGLFWTRFPPRPK